MTFEQSLECPVLDGLELFSTVVDVPIGISKIVKIPVLKNTQHDIYLPQRTVLGTITRVYVKSYPSLQVAVLEDDGPESIKTGG